MAQWGIIKFISIVITIFSAYFFIIRDGFSENYYSAFLFFRLSESLLLTHYIIALFAIRKHLWQLLITPKGRAQILLITALLGLSFSYSIALLFFYFGLHFALSDVYSRRLAEQDSSFFTEKKRERRYFRFTHIFFLFFTYLFAHYNTLYFFKDLQPALNILTFSVTFLLFTFFTVTYFIFALLRRKLLFPKAKKIDVFLAYLLPDLTLFVLAILCFHYNLHWSTIILYHIIFWLIYPMYTNFKKGVSTFKNINFYLVPSLAVWAITFYFLYPNFMEGPPIENSDLFTINESGTHFLGYHNSWVNESIMQAHIQNMYFGTIHIFLSFISSDLNPTFIRSSASLDNKDPFLKERS